MKKTTTIKAWAIINSHGGIIGSGWGTMQAWVFKKKYEAQEVIDNEMKSGFSVIGKLKIIPIQITFRRNK